MPNNFNNFYNPTNPYLGSSAGGYMASNTGYQQQTPGYSGFNNFQRPSGPQQQMIPGRQVSNVDEITPQEVPMDGSVSLFPQNDYSAIYAKTWTKDGTIATMKFVPEQPQATAQQKSPLEERLDRIDQNLEALNKRLGKPRPYPKHNKNSYPKKEVESNE